MSRSKGTPPGRLLSVLYAHVARRRTPPAMMRLWLSFVGELRSRWERNESLPNLGLVPGLDAVDGASSTQAGCCTAVATFAIPDLCATLLSLAIANCSLHLNHVHGHDFRHIRKPGDAQKIKYPRETSRSEFHLNIVYD